MASARLPWVSCLILVSSMSFGLSVIQDDCVECICEAIQGGAVCPSRGTCHDGVCGPFAITYPYWQDGGRPTVGLDDRRKPESYEKCAVDTTCARDTIRGYMNRFHQDCNGDRVENCWDYAAIHFHGGYGCNKPLPVQIRNVLEDCLGPPRLPVNQPTIPPVNQPAYPRPDPRPDPSVDYRPVQPQPLPETEDPDDLDENVVYPDRTTFPSIDVRFGD